MEFIAAATGRVIIIIGNILAHAQCVPTDPQEKITFNFIYVYSKNRRNVINNKFADWTLIIGVLFSLAIHTPRTHAPHNIYLFFIYLIIIFNPIKVKSTALFEM